MKKVDTHSTPEWKSWATIDDAGFLCTLGQLSEQRTMAYRKRLETERYIATQLGEKEAWPLRLIHVIVKYLGTDQALAFLHKTLEIEQKGGMMCADGSRRRSLGGVFFYLVKTQGPEAIRELGMWQPLPHQKKKAPLSELKKVDTSKAAATNENRQNVKPLYGGKARIALPIRPE